MTTSPRQAYMFQTFDGHPEDDYRSRSSHSQSRLRQTKPEGYFLSLHTDLSFCHPLLRPCSYCLHVPEILFILRSSCRDRNGNAFVLVNDYSEWSEAEPMEFTQNGLIHELFILAIRKWRVGPKNELTSAYCNQTGQADHKFYSSNLNDKFYQVALLTWTCCHQGIA